MLDSQTLWRSEEVSATRLSTSSGLEEATNDVIPPVILFTLWPVSHVVMSLQELWAPSIRTANAHVSEAHPWALCLSVCPYSVSIVAKLCSGSGCPPLWTPAHCTKVVFLIFIFLCFIHLILPF